MRSGRRPARCAACSPAPAPSRPPKTATPLLDTRLGAIESGEGIDWGTAEALALGTLVAEGYLDQGEVLGLDTRTGLPRRVLAPLQGSSFQSFDITPEGRFLYTVRTNVEGDVGMLSFSG